MPALIANTNVLDLIGLQNELTGVPINDAAVTVTVKDEDGINVAGTSWPITMTYVPASTGDYRAFLSETLPLVDKAKYTAVIDANGGANLVGHWELHFRAVSRSVQDA